MLHKIFIAIVILMATACSPRVNESIAKDIQTQVIKSNIKEYKSMDGFRQYCDSLNIPNDLELWDRTVFRSYESRKIVDEYFYIRYDSASDVFRVKIEVNDEDTAIVVTHRVIN